MLMFFEVFRSMGKIASDGPKLGQDIFFPTNLGLADILGRRDLNIDNFHFFCFLDPNILDFQVPRSPNFWISRSSDLQIPRSPNSQMISRFPRIPDAAARRILRSQPDPSPNALRDQIRRKGPCCDVLEEKFSASCQAEATKEKSLPQDSHS